MAAYMRKSEEMKKRNLRSFTAAYLIGLSISISSIASNTPTVADTQRDQVSLVLADMNKSAKEVIDTVVRDPQNAIDAGCLDGIMGIDVSVFAIDHTNVLNGVYQTIMNMIKNDVCNAATAWVNAQTAELDITLEAPFGLGSIDISQGSTVSDWQNVVSTDVEISNQEIYDKVGTKTLGRVPTHQENLDVANELAPTGISPSQDKREKEQSLFEMIDVKQIWSSPAEDY